MDSASRSLQALLRILHEIEWDLPGAPLNLTVQYVGDAQAYQAHSPGRDQPFTPTGLRDPAFGNTGPIEFSDVESVIVHCKPRSGATSEEYQAKFEAFRARVGHISGILVSPAAVEFNRRVVP